MIIGMGSPANYVTVRDGEITVAYSRNGALEILEISVFGPAVLTRFLDAWQRLDPTDEFDDAAEGGLLVDFDRRVLMSTTLETITGSPWPAPRWPHFKEPDRSGVS